MITRLSNVLQTQVAFTSGITAAQAALPSLLPYIVAEAFEGVAYQSLPSPKAGVLTPVTTLVTDLYNRIYNVSTDSWLS